MKAVILAGGLGTRLKPFTEIIPKPLLPIGEKSVLEIQIELLKKHGFSEIFLATNYKSEYIENFFGNGDRYGVKLTISKEEKPLGSVGPLSLLKDKLSDAPFLVMNGDVLSKCNFSELYQFGSQMNADLTVCIKEYQGYGIASKLLSNAIKYGKNNGFISLALEVNINNNSAIKLYKKYSFVPVEQSQDKIIMECIITNDKNE